MRCINSFSPRAPPIFALPFELLVLVLVLLVLLVLLLRGLILSKTTAPPTSILPRFVETARKVSATAVLRFAWCFSRNASFASLSIRPPYPGESWRDARVTGV